MVPHPSYLLDRVRSCRFLPIETYPNIVAMVQTPLGRVLLLVLFAIFLHPFSDLWIPVTVAAAAAAYAGQYRSRVVTLATLGFLLLYPGWIDWRSASLVAAGEGVGPEIVRRLNAAMLPLFFLISGIALYCVRRCNQRAFVRGPILGMHVVFLLLILLGASSWLRGISRVALWSFIGTFAAFFWFLCYALKDMRARECQLHLDAVRRLPSLLGFLDHTYRKGSGIPSEGRSQEPAGLGRQSAKRSQTPHVGLGA